MNHTPWLVLTLALTACVSTAAPPQGPSGTWHLGEFKLDAQEPAHLPSGGEFSLTLGADGRAFGKVACNSWQGRYTMAGDSLLIDKAVSTRMRCVIDDAATARLEPLFLSRLESGGRIEAKGDALEMVFADGLRWRFQRR